MLTPKEIAKLWTTVVVGQHVDFIDAVRLLLLTGQRREEISGLRWSEVDFDAKLLRLPPERTKNKREHLVPLSEPALEILRIQACQVDAKDRSNDARVFRSFGWWREKARLDAGLNIPAWHVHDIRRTVATMLGELGLAPPHIVETILNHVSGYRAGVAGVYQRAKYENECRAALDKWGKWVEALV